MKKFIFCLFLVGFVNCSFASDSSSFDYSSIDKSDNLEPGKKSAYSDTSSYTATDIFPVSSTDLEQGNNSNSEDTGKLLEDLEGNCPRIKKCCKSSRKRNERVVGSFIVMIGIAGFVISSYNLILAGDKLKEQVEFTDYYCGSQYEENQPEYLNCLTDYSYNTRPRRALQSMALLFFVLGISTTSLGSFFCFC